MTITKACIVGLIFCLLGALGKQTQSPPLPPPAVVEQSQSRFGTVDLFVDSQQTQLGAWEMEFKATTGQVEIVGIERGDNPDFHDPPYYDPSALKSNRIIVGAFNITSNLPEGNTRVAR